MCLCKWAIFALRAALSGLASAKSACLRQSLVRGGLGGGSDERGSEQRRAQPPSALNLPLCTPTRGPACPARRQGASRSSGSRDAEFEMQRLTAAMQPGRHAPRADGAALDPTQGFLLIHRWLCAPVSPAEHRNFVLARCKGCAGRA